MAKNQGNPLKSAFSVPRQTRSQREPAAEAEQKMFGFRISTEAHRELTILAAQTGKSMQQLCQEGLNLVFEQYDKPPIA